MNFQQVNARLVFDSIRVSGTSANIALYSLNIADDQTSTADIWVDGAKDASGHKDFINVGWIVSHSVNGDKLTRLFGYWHNAATQGGCYNTQCPGFVQVDNRIPINFAFQHMSTVGDSFKQYTAAYYLHQDSQTGNWWLTMTKDKVNVGYWPKELFSDLQNGATITAWGGTTFPGANGQYPPMGNGNKPNGKYKDTCFFDDIHYFIKDKRYDILKRGAEVHIDPTPCYDLQVADDSEPLVIYPYSFIFGGPGGSC